MRKTWFTRAGILLTGVIFAIIASGCEANNDNLKTSTFDPITTSDSCIEYTDNEGNTCWECSDSTGAVVEQNCAYNDYDEGTDKPWTDEQACESYTQDGTITWEYCEESYDPNPSTYNCKIINEGEQDCDVCWDENDNEVSRSCWDNPDWSGDDQSYGENPNRSSDDHGYGENPDNCFGVGNEDCRDPLLKDLYREIERMIREVKKLSRDNDGLEGYIGQLEKLEDKVDNVSSYDEVNESWEELEEIQNVTNSFRSADEIKRLEKEIEREEKRLEQDEKYLNEVAKDSSNEWKDKIEEYLDNIERIIELKKEIIDIMEDAEDDYWYETEELWGEMEDLYWTTDDFWWEFEEIKVQQWAGQVFEEIEEHIEFFLEDEYNDLPSDKQEIADEIIEIARTLIAEGKSAMEDGDEKAVEDILDKLDEFSIKAEELFGKTEPKFHEVGYDDDFNNNFYDITDEMSYEKQVQLVKNILSANPDIMQDILAGDSVLADAALKILDKVPENQQADYLQAKSDLKGIYDEIEEKNSSVNNYKDDFLGYNYFGDAMDQFIGYMEQVRDGTMTLEELKLKVDELKRLSKEAKHAAGILTFNDYDDSDWYYDSVEGMTDFLKGKKDGDDYAFAGRDLITFAEILKITLEKFGEGEADGTPLYAGAQDHWAKGYYVNAENMGLTLLDPNHLITRGEMARLIVEVTLGKATAHSNSSFSDLSSSDAYFDYIETLHDYEILTGDSVASGLPTVRSNDNINRAESAKVIQSAFDNLFFETVESGDFEYLLENL